MSAVRMSIIKKSVVPTRTRDVIAEMKRIGFPLVDGEPFTSNARFMFNRGLEGGSNFFVLLETAGDKFRAFFLNPDESREAAALAYKHTVISLSEKMGLKGTKFIDTLVEAVQRESSKKPKNVYFIQMHFHLGKIDKVLLNTTKMMLDDGVSSFGSCAINAAFAHTDYFIQTMHNNFKYILFLKMEKTLSQANITALPGIEATLPLYFREPWLPSKHTGPNPNPNGPHILLIGNSPQLEREIYEKYFIGGYYDYAPSTHVTKDAEKILSELTQNYGKRLLIVVAHPACDSKLPEVGLLERILYGEISVEKGLDLVRKYAQAVAFFNSTVDPYDFVDFEKIKSKVKSTFEGRNNAELYRRMSNINEAESFVNLILNKWSAKYGTKLSKTTLNLAFCQEMAERFRTQKIYESDSHSQPRLYFFLANGKIFYWLKQINDFGKGHTRLWLPPNSNKRLSPQELVALFHDLKDGKETNARLDAIIYSQMQDGILKISKERESNTLPQKVFGLLEKLYFYITKQGIVLANDTLKAILRKNKEDPMAIVGSDLSNSARGSVWWPE
ncbi:MAG: hypothetical protein QXW70_03630 [Candidatus Anstonellales archaeon]